MCVTQSASSIPNLAIRASLSRIGAGSRVSTCCACTPYWSSARRSTPDDLQILKHGFWNTHEQRAIIAQLVAALANPINASAFELADQAQSVYEGVMAALRSGDPNLSSSKVVIEGNDKLKEIRKRLRQLLDQARVEGRKTDRILKIGQKVREMNEAVAALILGTPGEEAF